MLTKQDIAAIRRADDICVHLNASCPAGKVRLIKRLSYDERQRNPFATDQEHELTNNVLVQLYGIDRQKLIADGTVQCFAMRGILHAQNSHLSCVLKTLREGDELTFEFYPDGHSNGYCAAQGLHADFLQLHVRRNGKRIATWEIETTICPENSARMCRGAPVTDSYLNAAAERRKAG